MKKPQLQNSQFTFKASLFTWKVDQYGEAKITLSIPKQESKQIAEISQHDNTLFQVAIVLIPEEVKEKTKVNDINKVKA